MTSTLHPLTPYVRFGQIAGRRWSVIQDGKPIGEITEVLDARGVRYEWRTPGMIGFNPICGNGTWWEAVAAVERRAALPVPMRKMPPSLDLAALRREVSKQETASDG